MIQKELAIFIQLQKKGYYNYKLESNANLSFEEFLAQKLMESNWINKEIQNDTSNHN